MNILLVILAIVELIMLFAISIQVLWNVRLHRSSKELIGTNKQLLGKIDVFERTDLLMMLANTAGQAKDSIIHLTYTFRTPEEEEEMGPLLDAVQRISGDVVSREKIRFLGPSHSSKADRLFCRHDAGATVKINDTIALYDIRFQVVDGKYVVITVGDPSTESRHGYLVESAMLGYILTRHFDSVWDEKESQDYEDYMKRLISEASESVPIDATPEFLGPKLGLNLKEIERLLKLIHDESRPAENGTQTAS